MNDDSREGDQGIAEDLAMWAERGVARLGEQGWGDLCALIRHDLSWAKWAHAEATSGTSTVALRTEDLRMLADLVGAGWRVSPGRGASRTGRVQARLRAGGRDLSLRDRSLTTEIVLPDEQRRWVALGRMSSEEHIRRVTGDGSEIRLVVGYPVRGGDLDRTAGLVDRLARRYEAALGASTLDATDSCLDRLRAFGAGVPEGLVRGRRAAEDTPYRWSDLAAAHQPSPDDDHAMRSEDFLRGPVPDHLTLTCDRSLTVRGAAGRLAFVCQTFLRVDQGADHARMTGDATTMLHRVERLVREAAPRPTGRGEPRPRDVVVSWSPLDSTASLSVWCTHERAWTTRSFACTDDRVWDAASAALRAAH